MIANDSFLFSTETFSRRIARFFLILALVVSTNCGSKAEVSKEQAQTAQYLRAFGQILEEYRKNMPTLQAEAAREAKQFDKLEKQDANAARLGLAHSMDRLLERIRPLISTIEELAPPEKLREYHDVNLECTKTQVDFIKQMADALRNQDSETYKSQMQRFNQYLRDCNARIQASLRKAGYNSPEDIRKAIEVGQ